MAKKAQQKQPGRMDNMDPRPVTDDPEYKGSGKLQGKIALITGGDSGIGEAVAIAFAKEGATAVAISYLEENEDALHTKKKVEEYGTECLLIEGDIGRSDFCNDMVHRVVDECGGLNILVNNAGEQHAQESLTDITDEQIEQTFRTNIFAPMYLTRAALKHLREGDCVINTASVVAYRGQPMLLDYSATKGAMVAFTRSLSQRLVSKGIRVNAVAPGPIWTPLIASTFPKEKVKEFGKDQPMKRPGQPFELAPAYVYLASRDSTYVSGQVIHVNGGEIVAG